jgi:hypothetical protein
VIGVEASRDPATNVCSFESCCEQSSSLVMYLCNICIFNNKRPIVDVLLQSFLYTNLINICIAFYDIKQNQRAKKLRKHYYFTVK